MSRGRHCRRTRPQMLPVCSVLAREATAEHTETPVPDEAAPGQRRRASFSDDGQLVAEPFPVFFGDLPVEPCTRWAPTADTEWRLLCGEELLAPAVAQLDQTLLDLPLLGQQPPDPHPGERAEHTPAASPHTPRGLAAPHTAPLDGPPTGGGGRARRMHDHCAPGPYPEDHGRRAAEGRAPAAAPPTPGGTSAPCTTAGAARGESRGQREESTALAAAGPRSTP